MYDDLKTHGAYDDLKTHRTVPYQAENIMILINAIPMTRNAISLCLFYPCLPYPVV